MRISILILLGLLWAWPVLAQSTGSNLQQVNLKSIGGNALTTTLPVSGTITVTDGAGAMNVIVDSGTIATTVADGANVVLGAVADAAASAGGTGTVSAKLRNATSLLNSISANTLTLIGTISSATADTSPSSMVLTGGAYNSTELSPTNGQSTALQIDSKGRLKMTLRDAAGNDRGVNINASGQLSTSVDNSITIGTFPDNEPFNIAQMNGVTVSMDNGASGTGVQRVTIANDSTGEIRVADDSGNQIPSATSAPAQTARGLNVRNIPLDPCSGAAKTYFPVDIVTAATTEIANAVASQYYYFCSIFLISAGTQNVTIVEDDTDACASPTAGIIGGVTAGEGPNLTAQVGFTLGNGLGSIARTAATNRYICLITSAAVQLSGVITVVAAP